MGNPGLRKESSMNKTSNTFRFFLLWVRRWLRTAKPTEWISALTAFFGVVGAVTTGVIVLNSGLLDAKRSELNILTLKHQDAEKELRKTQDAIAERDAKIKELLNAEKRRYFFAQQN